MSPTQVREDARLQLFFRDMSYSSFKNLADAYVQRELTTSRPNVNPQEIQFAYTVHLTATVAGICSQAVNRIMGFGTRYLEDSFAPYGKMLQVRRRMSLGLSSQQQVRASAQGSCSCPSVEVFQARLGRAWCNLG